MRLIRIRTLLGLAVIAAVIAWGALSVWDNSAATLPGVPWTAPIALLLVAAVLLAIALSLRSRFRRQRSAASSPVDGQRSGDRTPPRPVDPFFAARSVALAKACAHVGAVVVGLYAGYGIFLLPDLDIALRRDRAIVCAVTVLAGVVLVAVAVWLERVCRLPEDHDNGPQLGTA